MNKRKKGFTIVELVIVIAVIGILAAILIPTFSGLIQKANLTSDSSLVKNINTQLEIAEIQDGKNKTMYDALLDAKEAGYLVSNINARSDNQLVWDETIDRFALIDKEGNLVAGEIKATKKVNLWKISTEVDEVYSTYYIGTPKVINTQKGFDAGDVEGITEINYSKSNSPQNVVIRTNSESTTLTINASIDTVAHYGEVGALNVVAINTASYHEYGKVGFAEVKVGRIVLETGSNIEHIHINSTGNNAFGNVVIKDNGTQNLPKAITRDEVNVASATLVVTVEATNGAQEAVYVYASGTVGTTEKTTTQNVNVNSDLGVLVLDNGTTNKALNETEKAETKDEVASEAVSSEFANQEGNNNYVARIGQTLQAAVNAAVDGNTIALLKDIVFSPSESLIVNKDITLNLCNRTISGAHDPLIVIGSDTASTYNPSSSHYTHTGHLTIKGEGTVTSSTWDMICVYPDAVLDVYGGSYVGMQCPFFICGGTLNTYGGYFTSNALYNPATTSYANYIVQVKNAGIVNITAGEFFTPEYGCYGVYLDNASVSNFGSTTGNGPVFNTWRPCIASNGSESHAVLANIYSGTYHSYRSDNKTGENSVIQLANNTEETQTLNVYGGTFEQTGSNENRCIFNVRYKGTINVNISGGRFIATSASRLFNGVGSGTSWPSAENVHVTVTNNAITETQNVKIYNTSDVYQSAKDFEIII